MFKALPQCPTEVHPMLSLLNVFSLSGSKIWIAGPKKHLINAAKTILQIFQIARLSCTGMVTVVPTPLWQLG